MLSLLSLSQKDIVSKWQNRTILLFLLFHPGAGHVSPLICHQEEGCNSVLHLSKPPGGSDPSVGHRRCSRSAGLISVLWGVTLLLTCCIANHSCSVLSIFATQLIFWIYGLASAISSGTFSADAFKLLLPHFLFPPLLKLWLNISWTFLLYPLWLLVSFIFSTYLSLWAISWIISPVLSSRSQGLSLCAVLNNIHWVFYFYVSLFPDFCFPEGLFFSFTSRLIFYSIFEDSLPVIAKWL